MFRLLMLQLFFVNFWNCYHCARWNWRELQFSSTFKNGILGNIQTILHMMQTNLIVLTYEFIFSKFVLKRIGSKFFSCYSKSSAHPMFFFWERENSPQQCTKQFIIVTYCFIQLSVLKHGIINRGSDELLVIRTGQTFGYQSGNYIWKRKCVT